MLHLAEQPIGEHAPILLAAGLTAVIHQHILAHSISPQIVLTESGNLGDSVRSLIRERRIGRIASFVDQQMGRLQQGHSPIPSLNIRPSEQSHEI